MSPRKVQVTSKQLTKLLEDLMALPEETIGEHLSDDQFISYSLSILSPEETSIVEQHFASCSDCASEMEHLLEAAEAWNKKTTRTQPATRTIDEYAAALEINRRPKGNKLLRVLADSLKSLLAITDEGKYTSAWAAEANKVDARRVWSCDDSQSSLSGQGFLDSNGHLTIVFSSNRVELENRRLRLRISSEEEEIVQERVLEANESKTEVSATFLIPGYQLPEEVEQVLLDLEEAEP